MLHLRKKIFKNKNKVVIQNYFWRTDCNISSHSNIEFQIYLRNPIPLSFFNINNHSNIEFQIYLKKSISLSFLFYTFFL